MVNNKKVKTNVNFRTLFRITMVILLGLTFIPIFNFLNQDGKALSELSKKNNRYV